jgi:serine/threonine-protein kinase
MLSPDPLEQARLIDRVCDRFEAAWQAGPRPRIETFLAGLPDEEASAALRELVALEVELRRRAGEGPTDDEYRRRFPGQEGAVAAAFEESAAPAAANLPRLEGYELLSVLGRGGMGVVYRARQTGLGRVVALKVTRPDVTAEGREVLLTRFRQEARATALLQHPHIVPIYEVGEAGGLLYYSMLFVEGRNLAELLREGPVPPRRAAALLEPVARAVHYAHQRGVLHRDLKPRNILLDGAGRPLVADFGLAKRLHEPANVTMTGQVLGTPAYMAPEQAQDTTRATVASDVYGLGATLYALLTGGPPFQAPTLMETLLQVMAVEPAPPRLLNPTVEADLETITLTCLDKDPARRYPSSEALADDLARFLKGQPIWARRGGWATRLRRWARHNPPAAALAAALVLCVVGWVVSLAVIARGYEGWTFGLTCFVAGGGVTSLAVFAWLRLRRGRRLGKSEIRNPKSETNSKPESPNPKRAGAAV